MSSFTSLKFHTFLTIMSTRLIWLSPDIASLRYNNSADILNRLSNSLLENNYHVESIIYVYTFEKVNTLHSFFDGIPVEYISSPMSLFSRNSHYGLNIVFFDGYRLPDRLSLLLMNIRRQSNFKTFYIQHGRYTKLDRKYINKHILKKSFFYSLFLFNAFFYMPLSTLRHILYKKPIFIDFSFIYSPLKYWIQFHALHGLIFESSYLINDRDMKRFSLKSDSSSSKKRTFFYIAQTLVEDGRCSKAVFFDFWRSLVDFSIRNDFCIHIRLHPRSSKKFWKKIFDETNNVELKIISSPVLMRYDFVITHNSAMSVFFLNNSIPVCFFRLSSEPLPLGLESHPFSYSFDNSTNVYDSLLSFQNRSFVFCPSPTVASETASYIPSELVSDVDLEAKLEELTISLLKSSSF